MDERVGFPGPDALGRGLVVAPGGEVPPAARGWPRLRIDDDVLAAPDEAVATLDAAWRARQPTVVELAVPMAAVKQPETCDRPPYDLDPGFAFTRERLHFLIWANRYDGRGGDEPRWHHVARAGRLGASPSPDPAAGDVVLPDGTAAWVDGGPRTSHLLQALGATGSPDDAPSRAVVVHVNQLWAGSLEPDRWRPPGDTLAPDQLAAVAHPGGPARVLAPAGSGKTRVLTARLRHLLVDRRWAPGTVTALAYNTRAAEEMRSRTADVAGAQVRTLHSLGFDILGQARGGRPRVLDERATRDIIEQLAPVRPRANEDVLAPYFEALAEVRAALWSPELVEAQRDDVPDFARVFAGYRERLADMGAIDFDEQVYGAVEALLRDPEVRQAAQRRCAHVLLDELQDLTPAQLLMVRLLAAPTYDVYGVGDDDQVIYGYAGADPRFLVDYDQFFPQAASYLLEVNYRCPPPVVEAATHLLSYNHIRVPKTISPKAASQDDQADDGSGLRVERYDDREIGSRLVELVRELLDGGVPPSDVAVLTRVNAGLLAPQVLLGEAGVPVHSSVDERMLDRTGTRAALAWLRLAGAAATRQPLDGRDLATVARRPSRGLSPGILNALGRGTWPLSRLASFAAGLDDDRLREKLTGFHADLSSLGDLLRSRRGEPPSSEISAETFRHETELPRFLGATTAELLLHVRDVIGLGRALDRLDDARSAARGGHIDDLDALILVARAHPDPSDFEAWLRQRLRTRTRPTGGPDTQTPAGTKTGSVTLSTVHRVKGLEWPYVVVWDASEGIMPHRLSTSGRLVEEERRVFHVALTRARRRSTVLARKDAPSPFLAELTGEAPRPAATSLADREDGLTSADAAAGRRSAAGAPSAFNREDAQERLRRRRSRGGASGDDNGTPLDPEASKRMEALREWRRRRAGDDKVPAYVVLHDRHMEGIARRAPASLDELAACDGIGPTKLDRYGDDILAALADLG